MNSLRICFYTVVAVLSMLFTILNHNVNTPMDEQQRLYSNAMKNMMMVRQSTQQHQGEGLLKATIAPWTKMPAMESAGKLSTRSFVFVDIANLDSEYGVPMTSVDRKGHDLIKKQIEKRLCLRSAKFSKNRHSILCKRKVQLLRCITCTEQDGTWYSAVSRTGAVFGRVYNGIYLHYPNYNDGPFMYQQLDIAVPIAGQDDKLRKFVARLRPAIRQFRSGSYGSKIIIRLLITRFPFDKPALNNTVELEKFRQNLTVTAGLNSLADEVVIVPLEGDIAEFSRAKAINAIHQVANHDDNSALAVIDVDLSVGPKFLRNALTFPFPQASAYFPIMWSLYNPDTVHLVDEFIPRIKHSEYSEHHGHWRKFSFGMYVIAGSDALQLSMDETFVGWGGEDNDFFAKVQKKLNIIRLRETGLTHVWHPKHCDLGGFVTNKYFRECVGSMARFEGSQLGMYLEYLKEQDRINFDEIMSAAKRIQDDGKKSDVELEIQEAGGLYGEKSPTVLLGVVSSRENFSTRVRGIVSSWGDPENIPEGTTIRFFVGSPPESSEFFGKSAVDVANLAEIAGIQDPSTIVVMDGVADDEYPPVRKNTAMIAALDKIAETFENDADAPSTFQWIYQVDDDAYVNFDGMLSFLRNRNSDGFSVYGERGSGRAEDREGIRQAGLVKPYCTGGPGYVMSRKTVQETSSKLTDCVRNADKSEYRKYIWHSDSVIGLCIYNSTGAGCWDDDGYNQNRIFRHNLLKEYPFLKTTELPRTIAIHPFKDQESMMKQHMRYVELDSNT